MAIEKDNLPNADGQEQNLNIENQNSESKSLSENDTTGKSPIDIQIEGDNDAVSAVSEQKNIDSTEIQSTDTIQNSENDTTVTKENPTSDAPDLDDADETTGKSPIDIEITDNAEKDVTTVENQEKAMDFDNAADSDQSDEEDKTQEENETEVPQKDYDEMSLGEMVTEAGSLLKTYSALMLKDAFNGLKDAFKKKSDEEERQAKESFLESGGNEIDFRHDNRHRTPFYDIYTEYRSKVNQHYKTQEAKLQENLTERKEIIEELKALYTEPAESNREIFQKFRELKTRWHNAGRIPKADAETTFKTYYFHLDNFNEFLDLNQELRKMDYDHNLEVRKNIIDRAKKLIEEENVQKALNELQYLHRMWKEEAVPVDEEHREPTWQEFKDITTKIHDRKAELNERLAQQQKENLDKKQEIIAKIDNILSENQPKTHNHWQKKIKEVNTLRDEFFATGRVPKEDNQPTWDQFKEATRKFNKEKNNFYKNLKAEQMENLEKKRELVKIAQEHRESKDWNESVKVVKRIQSEWKKIGHVPRKYSDKIWKEFSEANNHFFDRYKNRNNEKIEKQKENLKQKQEFLKQMEIAEKPTNQDELLNWLNEKRIEWSSIGYVPNGKQDINKDFNTLTEKMLSDSGLSKDAVEKAQWNSQIEHIKSTLDDKMLRNLKMDVRKQMDETQKEVSQLQTNLAFFSNADDSNPLFKNAIQNIENKVSELESLESKYEDLRLINLEALAENQSTESDVETIDKENDSKETKEA